MSVENLVVFLIVLGAALFSAWRLAGPGGRLKILRGGVALLTSLRATGAATRLAATHDRLAAATGGSPCSTCAPDTRKLRRD